MNVESIADVLESYNFIEYKKTEWIIWIIIFSIWFRWRVSKLDRWYWERYKKNSVVRVRQLYDSYPNVLNGEIPVEMNNLLEGLNELTSTENIDYERKY